MAMRWAWEERPLGRGLWKGWVVFRLRFTPRYMVGPWLQMTEERALKVARYYFLPGNHQTTILLSGLGLAMGVYY